MSYSKSFLPKHPKIIKKIKQSQNNSALLNSSNQSSIISKITSWEDEDSIIKCLIDRQKQMVENLHSKVSQLANNNSLMEEAFKYFDNEAKKKQLAQLIQNAKIEQQQITIKIKNCQKVEQSTTPEEYYLWQKKKKMDEHHSKINLALNLNQSERIQLQEVCEKYKQKIAKEREQIQIVLQQIEKTQSSQKQQDSMNDVDRVDPQKAKGLREQYNTLVATTSILRQNNEILSSQLVDNMESIEKSLRKSFENSKSSLLREIQSIKKQIQNTDPQSPAVSSPSKGRQISPTEAITDYINKLNQVRELLTQEEQNQSSGIVLPFDWGSLKWEQYVDVSQLDNIASNYLEKYQSLKKQYEELDSEVEAKQTRIKQDINDTVRMNQESLQIESATNKLVKTLQMLQKK